MADDPLDLSGKKEPEGEAEAKQPGRKKEGGGAQRIYTRPDRAERAWERDLRTRLERTIERMAEWREGRDDHELATVFREDGLAMIGGVIALARPFAWMRPVLVTGLTVAEPALAFGRLFRVMLMRIGTARAQRQDEAWAAAEEQRLQEEAEQIAEGDGLGH